MAEIKKLTKKEKYGMVLNYIQDNEMLVEFINNEINLLTKKASSSSKTKTQIENENIKEKLVAILNELDNPITITDLQKVNSEMGAYSNQKISALLTQLVNEKRVCRIVDKKKTYFSTKEVANI
jgi:SHS2 domain-containing protein